MPSEFTLPSEHGARAVDLLSDVVQSGIATLRQVVESAVHRQIKSGGRTFTQREMGRLVNAFAASTAAAELLGRTSIVQQAVGKSRFSAFNVYEQFAVPIRPQVPRQALEYFLKLVPKLGINPERFGERMERYAFTLAKATEETVLSRVQKSLAIHMAGGRQQDSTGRGSAPLSGAELVQQALDDAGVSTTNPQYAEMSFRTNVLDSYHTGIDRQLSSPDMQQAFPVWQYLGIRDGREGDDHRPKFDRYYPGSASFAAVRGDRPFNCRCSKRVITRREWERLQQAGAALESSW